MNDLIIKDFLSHYVSISLLFSLFSFFFFIVFWLFMRPLILWYFKINESINLLTEIRNLLLNKEQYHEDIDSNFSETTISKPFDSNSQLNTEINPMPKSSWNVDKPILNTGNERSKLPKK